MVPPLRGGIAWGKRSVGSLVPRSHHGYGCLVATRRAKLTVTLSSEIGIILPPLLCGKVNLPSPRHHFPSQNKPLAPAPTLRYPSRACEPGRLRAFPPTSLFAIALRRLHE